MTTQIVSVFFVCVLLGVALALVLEEEEEGEEEDEDVLAAFPFVAPFSTGLSLICSLGT